MSALKRWITLREAADHVEAVAGDRDVARQQLLAKLLAGDVPARGTRHDHAADLHDQPGYVADLAPIESDQWDLDEVDWDASSLRAGHELETRYDGRYFLGVEVREAAVLAAWKGSAEKSVGGRPSTHDWAGAAGAVVRYAQAKGLPDTQAKLTKMLLNWFADEGRSEPEHRQVERFVAEVYKTGKT